MAIVALKEPTKRNNKNRIAGTIETKLILSVTKDITRSCLIEKVLPAIRSKWPASTSSAPIFIQQDNARPHIGVNDLKFMEATHRDGFDIKAIQSLQYQNASSNVDEFVEVVEKSFNEMKVERLNHVFLTLQCCMNEVMKDRGDNNYKVPHMNKEILERENDLPLQVRCDVDAVNQALTLLQH
ncbi:hypothetical protein KY290_032424 [Solanum tuberosum]|uniref:Transposase n=1 Tax=Solanum tuberosum TaxID=4113 RepID=A0ABQ7UC32_SOLTU|nr:hypothetical protein KY284_030344 [Solanum tuberosum]KAH0744431.1 hypothetical protein KY290_032424 [Solanum tuberosum]